MSRLDLSKDLCTCPYCKCECDIYGRCDCEEFLIMEEQNAEKKTNKKTK